MSHFIISGPGGGAINRVEINSFVTDEKHFSLYIQALRTSKDIFWFNKRINSQQCPSELMYTKESQAAIQSFFQVGGIHGVPYIPWDNATVDPAVDSDPQWAGYCVHGSVLFPTWHRPYVSTFEVNFNYAPIS